MPTGQRSHLAQPRNSTAEGGINAIVEVRVERHMRSHDPLHPCIVQSSDPTGFSDVEIHNARKDYLLRSLPLGQTSADSGRIDRFDGELNIVHLDHIVPEDVLASIQIVEPVYPMTAGRPPKVLRKAIEAALERLPKLPEWIDPAILKQRQWDGWVEALRAAHHPQDDGELSTLSPPRMRLAYDELLSNQLALAIVRSRNKRKTGRSNKGHGGIRKRIVGKLPYTLTKSQEQALAEIIADMAEP